MDTAQIVTAAAALLGPYLAKAGEAVAKKIGEAVWDKVANLHQAIRRKFSKDKDEYAQKTLQRLEEQPTNEGRQAALADVLEEKAQTDPAFAQELAQLVRTTAEDKHVSQFLTQVYDQAQVDKIINIGQVGVVNID
jgi:hypothetical protein